MMEIFPSYIFILSFLTQERKRANDIYKIGIYALYFWDDLLSNFFRLQDLCDELLAEVSDEKVLYNLWASDNSLEDYLCR